MARGARTGTDQTYSLTEGWRHKLRTRWIFVISVLSAALVLPATASARVRLVYVTSPVPAGSYATLRASVSPSRSRPVAWCNWASDGAGA